MVIVTVYRQAEIRRYYVPLFSVTTVFVACVYALALLTPFGIIFASSLPWAEYGSYIEQPLVQFKGYYASVYTRNLDHYVCSSYNDVKMAYGHQYRSCFYELRRVDNDTDGRMDNITLNLEVPMLDHEEVTGVHLLIFLQHQLFKYSNLTMECMASVITFSAWNASSVYVEGELTIVQEELLQLNGLEDTYNNSILSNSSFVYEYNPALIITNYQLRKVRTELQMSFVDWGYSRRSNQEPFKVSASMRIPKSRLYYKPELGQEIIIWLQLYIPLLIPFIVSAWTIISFVLDKKMFWCTIMHPKVKTT